MKDISVIICTYNRSESLRRAFFSLEKLVLPDQLKAEFLIIDNNSSDDTREVIEEFISGTDLDARYIFEASQGLSNARNRGVKESKGNIITFTDDDVLVDKNWLKNISREFKRDKAACVGGKILPVWERQKPVWLTEDLYGDIALLDLGEARIDIKEPTLWGANLSFRADIFERYGLFNSMLGHSGDKLYGGEETRLVRTLLENGELVIYSPDILVHHCIPEGRMRKSYFRKRSFDRGELNAIMEGEYRHRNIMGIPYYMLKKLVIEHFKFISASIKAPESRFKQRLLLDFDLGYISGRYKIWKSSGVNR